MLRRKSKQRSEEAAPPPAGSDFHGYLARGLAGGYRLAVMVLDDPIEAGAVLRGATMAAWLAGGDRPRPEVDEAFGRRLAVDLEDALHSRRADGSSDAELADPLEAAVAGIAPRLQIALARAFGPWNSAAPESADQESTTPETGDAMRAVEARLDAGGAPTPPSGDVEPLLRKLYQARDPGEPAPLELRMRLQQDLTEADAAASERVRLTRSAGWRFVFNAFLAIVVLTLVVALFSIVGVRSSPVAAGDPTSDPATPLTISSIAVVQRGIDGPDVLVGATQRSFVAAFAASPLWRVSSRQCNADVVGVLDWQGQATWIGQHAGHADSIVGDPSSMSAYVPGLGPYCQAGRFTSLDGGSTWAAGTLPANAATSPSWLSFDPTRAHFLLAYYPGKLYASTDSGGTWKSRTSTVAPLAFDSTGRLAGWSPGKLFESLDEGVSWHETGPGPTVAPVAAGATSGGILIGARDGLWWYPLTSAPGLVKPGRIFSMATLGDGAVVVGADAAGHPWLGTVDSTMPGISIARLPADVAGLLVSSGDVAVNDSGAVVAFSGTSSAIVFATFTR